MSAAQQQVQETTLSRELEILQPEIAKVLPEHVTPEKFMRVATTAIAQSPALRKANRRTLLTACVKAATDGLVPDGREAALVIYGQDVVYMPMVSGILKKVRNSGELKQLTVNVVYEADDFRYWTDDLGEHILHEPKVLADDRGRFLAVYAIAKTKDGGMYHEVMSRSQVEQVRNVSKAKNNGPWKDWYDEMAKKTVIRRLSKRLPMSTDLVDVIQRDDALYDLDQNGRSQQATSGVAAAKATLGLPQIPIDDDPPPDVNTETGETTAPAPQQQQAATETPAELKWTTESAIKALESKRKTETLDDQWKNIVADYAQAHQRPPMEIEAKYGEMRESLLEREAIQGDGEQDGQ